MSIKTGQWRHRVLPAFFAAAMAGTGGQAWARTGGFEAEPADTRYETFAPLSESILAAFNTQIGHEMSAAYAYLDLANHFNEKNLEGIGHWYTAQFYEEINHARKFMNYVKAKGQSVQLTSLQTPKLQKTTPLEIFKQTLKAEQDQTQRIQKLYEQSVAAGEFTAVSFLKFFLDEQVQEEDMVTNIVDRLALLAGDPTGLLALDRELAARPIPAVFVPVAP